MQRMSRTSTMVELSSWQAFSPIAFQIISYQPQLQYYFLLSEVPLMKILWIFSQVLQWFVWWLLEVCLPSHKWDRNYISMLPRYILFFFIFFYREKFFHLKNFLEKRLDPIMTRKDLIDAKLFFRSFLSFSSRLCGTGPGLEGTRPKAKDRSIQTKSPVLRVRG